MKEHSNEHSKENSKENLKENLVWKLDFLESQLDEEAAANARLARTKYALEKLNKKGKTNQNKDELLDQIKAVKQQIVDRKVHHGLVEVNRCLKKALQVEALKIRKRIKKLSEVDMHKKQTLQTELEILSCSERFKKDVLSETLVHSSLKKAFMKTSTPDYISPELQKKCLNNGTSDFSAPENNIFARIRNTGTVKAALSDMTQSIDAVINRKPKEVKQTDNEKEKAKNKPSESKANVKTVSWDHNDHDSESDSESDSDSEVFYDAVSVDPVHDSANIVPESNTKHANDLNDHSNDSTSESNESSDSNESESDDDGFFNSQLPELATGYYSGSDDDEDNYDYDNDRTVKSITSERKNRRGQRARRKIWEAKYGSAAKHILKQKEEERAKREQKQREYEEREARRREKRRAAGIPEDSVETTRAPKRGGPSGLVKPSSFASSSKPQDADNTPLHPSWQAKKQQKQAKFQGKKIKFD